MPNNLSPSLCIDAVFGDLSLEDACRKTADANISTIEFWSWWDKDLVALQSAVNKYNLSISCCCTKFISLVEPSLREDYLQGLRESIAVAKRLNIDTLISQVGDFIDGVPREVQRQSLIDGLKAAAKILEAENITLVVEPLNELVDHKGYYLISSSEAFDVIKKVSSSKVKVLFDIYHQQISEGNVLNNILPNIEFIGHFHAAGNPGRHELQSGELNFPLVFAAIQQSSFNGFIGLEYWTKNEDPIQALQEVSDWLN
ncbi:TIM barrel protein [Paraglaciecola sp.]|uniref:TIM barrel protein n=1 Tax=Paraglaciecola sp. TaxID=1920173 RepID=UPI003EF32029